MNRTRIMMYILLLLATITSTAIFAYKAYQSETEYSNLKSEYNEVLTWEDRLLNLNALIFPNSEWEPKRTITEDQLTRANKAHDDALNSTILGFISIVLGLLLMLLVVRKADQSYKYMSLAILLTSLALLGSGVMSPMMEIEVFEDDLTVDVDLEPVWTEVSGLMKNMDAIAEEVPLVRTIFGIDNFENSAREYLYGKFPGGKLTYEGRMYFYYQNKSAIGVIGELNKQGNYFVLAALLIFSFIVPFLKLTVSMIFLFSKKAAAQKRLRKTIGYIGKLSMGDVFVIAMYLSYFSFYNMNAGIQTSSNTLVGIYFFSGYVLLSIFSYFLVEKHIKLNYHE